MYGWLAFAGILVAGGIWLKTTLNDNAELKARYERSTQLITDADNNTKLERKRAENSEAAFQQLQRSRGVNAERLKGLENDLANLRLKSPENTKWADTDVPADYVDGMRQYDANRRAARIPRAGVAESPERGLRNAPVPTQPVQKPSPSGRDRQT